MAKTTRKVIKDIVIIGVGVLAIWVGLQAAFGTNPFYVVVSGSMIPALEVDDVIVVQGHIPFEEVGIGDIIVFNRPDGNDRIIVHRVESIISEEPREIRTKGDANRASIPGTDFPITDEEYIGKVIYTIPQVGYATKLIKPPINYIIIVVVVGAMIAKQFLKKKEGVVETEAPEQDAGRPDTGMAKDSEYLDGRDAGEKPEEQDGDKPPDEPGTRKL